MILNYCVIQSILKLTFQSLQYSLHFSPPLGRKAHEVDSISILFHNLFFILIQATPSPHNQCNPPPPPPHNLNHNRKVQARSRSQPNHSPSCPDNSLIRKLASSIPHQVPDAIERMERKRHRKHHLRRNLSGDGPRGEACRQRRRPKVQPNKRRGQVSKSEEIEAPG